MSKATTAKLISGYHPDKSRVNDDTLSDFLRAPVSGNLNEVPGVGPATIAVMQKHGVSTTFALIGKFLMLKEAGTEPVEHVDRFYYWMDSIGTAPGFRAGICRAVAEKANTMMPGLYDEQVYCCA